jgi:DegV family protein with EDD domain
MTDSAADLTPELVDGLGLDALYFTYVIDGQDHLDDFGRTASRVALYDAMRAGGHPSTAQLPRQEFVALFERYAEAGQPLLYLALSSGLSGTFETASSARDEVLTRFAGADIRIVDTKAASAAEGLMVYEAALQRRAGVPLTDIAAWAETARPCLHGYFTVDDLEYLRRGGRVSGAVAAVGGVLDVKPLLQLTAHGTIEPLRNVRGRHKAMRALAGLVTEYADGRGSRRVFIAHADCAEDAEHLATLVRESADVRELRIFEAGPVIGSHGGPGFLGLTFWGKRR